MLKFDEPIPDLDSFEKESWVAYRKQATPESSEDGKRARIYGTRHAFIAGLELGLERTKHAAAFIKVHSSLQVRSLIQQAKIIQLEKDLTEARNSIRLLLGK